MGCIAPHKNCPTAKAKLMEAILTLVDRLMGCMYKPKELRTPMVIIKMRLPAKTMSHKDELDCLSVVMMAPLRGIERYPDRFSVGIAPKQLVKPLFSIYQVSHGKL